LLGTLRDPSVRNFQINPPRLSEVLNAKPAALDDTLQRADRNRLTPVDGNDHLPAVGVPPLLMASLLPNQYESVPAQHAGNIFSSQGRKMSAHGKDTSTSLEPSGVSISEGSNQSSKASRAF
jgi:hypothetical protein